MVPARNLSTLISAGLFRGKRREYNTSKIHIVTPVNRRQITKKKNLDSCSTSFAANCSRVATLDIPAASEECHAQPGCNPTGLKLKH
eukprot:CAMPEP_0171058342 /NCGR_PEP_ID=MMETSP0766_2-20121228/2445_1 /TAXON_ID=439317 /ORGANISM="Gambierdiscus australes, Strain CAWD 149" /LENGTH=86 /DNA_ID=CAMNT_0011513611 /DNA_START=140 /DNA_END=400 /DNA_ORIENTATION=-